MTTMKFFRLAIASALIFAGCAKEINEADTTLQTNREATMQVGEQVCDNFCDGQPSMQGNHCEELVFAASVPSTITRAVTLTEAGNVEIFLQDCCIRDDVVEVYVDGCLVGVVDSRGGENGTHAGETIIVTLAAGTHEVQYINTVSDVGLSGWTVCVTTSAPTTIIIDGVDTGIPDIDATCGSSLQDEIDACAEGVANHGEYVSCVARKAEMWVAMGLISEEQKDLIVSVAAQTDIGKK